MRTPAYLALIFSILGASAGCAYAQDRVFALVDETRAVIYCQVGEIRVDHAKCPLGPALITNIVTQADGPTIFLQHEGVLEFNVPDGLEGSSIDGCGMVVESPNTVNEPKQSIGERNLSEINPSDPGLLAEIEERFHIKSPIVRKAVTLSGQGDLESQVLFMASNIKVIAKSCDDLVGCPYYYLLGVYWNNKNGSRSSRIISAVFDHVLTDAGGKMQFLGFSLLQNEISVVFLRGNGLNYSKMVMKIKDDGWLYPHSRCN